MTDKEKESNKMSKFEVLITIIGVILSLIGIIVSYFLGSVSIKLSETANKLDKASLYLSAAQGEYNIDYESQGEYNFAIFDLPDYAIAKISSISGYLTQNVRIKKNEKVYFDEKTVTALLQYSKLKGESVSIENEALTGEEYSEKHYNNQCSFNDVQYKYGDPPISNLDKYTFEDIVTEFNDDGFKITKDSSESTAFIQIIYEVDLLKKYQYCKIYYDQQGNIEWLEIIDIKEFHENRESCINNLEGFFKSINREYRVLIYN